VLVLARSVAEQLRVLAAEAAPAECCGLLIGRDEAPDRVVQSLEPVPNAGRERYHVPAQRFAAAERAARASGAYVCGVFHSHPGGDAEPSASDLAEAWPGFDYVIIGAGGEMRAWRLSEDRLRFVEVRTVATRR
jgi:proteasome lid subunit RPN8/RPN11